MTCESEAARFWAAMLGLALMIAMTVTLGYWLCVYHREAEEARPFLNDPPTVIEMILDDLTPVF
jgi:hypothetical protein